MKMKRILSLCSILVFAQLSGVCLARDEASINLHFPGGGHYNIPTPAEQPDVYYNNVSQTIIIDGTGEVNYYDVEILSLTTFDVMIATQVNGYYDTIDVSSLPVGEYVITIDSPTGNSFEGFFETY